MLLIVSQDGKVRINYNNVCSINFAEYEKADDSGMDFFITADLNSGDGVTLGKFLSKEKAEKALIALDEAIIEVLACKRTDEYKDRHIFYMGECEE